MKLTDDPIEITLGVEVILLRPTLRCGLRLAQREGSFPKLISDLQEGSLRAAHFVLADHFHHPAVAQCILDAGLEHVCAQLILHAISCAGFDPDAEPDENAKPSTITLADHLTSLYRIATGWLSWTPQIALDSTPAEIMEAYKGRLDMLKAIFGGDETPKPTKPDADKLKAAFRALGAKPIERRA